MTRTSGPTYPSQVPRARSRPAEPRELRARGRNTKRRLLDAGATVLAAKGYHATRVDDVVKLAQTSHGTFYLYFSNKEELFRALAAEVAEEMQVLAEALEPLTAGTPGRERLERWIKEFVELYRRHGPVVRAWTEAEIGGSEFGRLGTDLLTQFTGIIVGRISEVAPADLDPAIAALVLVAMLERLNYYALTEQVQVEPSAIAETLARVTHASLFGR
jgi:AcrR family transcriptional regulator